MGSEEKIQTPFWDLRDWSDQVYEPSEDSFFLLDALEEELTFIKRLNPTHVLEIGCGSGIIITALACAIRNSSFIAVDINPYACLATKKTAEMNQASVNVVQSDLVEGFKLVRNIDVLVFNPPYVPSLAEEERSIIDKAWAGNSKGRSTTDRLFPLLPHLMSSNSAGYIVALDENNPSEMCQILRGLGFEATIVKKRKIIGERLSILKFVRSL